MTYKTQNLAKSHFSNDGCGGLYNQILKIDSLGLNSIVEVVRVLW